MRGLFWKLANLTFRRASIITALSVLGISCCDVFINTLESPTCKMTLSLAQYIIIYESIVPVLVLREAA